MWANTVMICFDLLNRQRVSESLQGVSKEFPRNHHCLSVKRNEAWFYGGPAEVSTVTPVGGNVSRYSLHFCGKSKFKTFKVLKFQSYNIAITISFYSLWISNCFLWLNLPDVFTSFKICIHIYTFIFPVVRVGKFHVGCLLCG